jgi:hypothetical protein
VKQGTEKDCRFPFDGNSGNLATILDKTLETIPANITKLLNIDKTNFVSPSPPPQFNVVNNAETTFGNIP